MSREDLLRGFAAPAAWAAVWMVAGVALRWRQWDRATPFWISAVALGGGFVIAWMRFAEVKRFPPRESGDWLPWFIVVAVVWGIVESSVGRVPWWARGFVAVAMAALLVRLIVAPLIPRFLTPAHANAWVVLLALAMAAWFLSLDALARRVPGASVPLVLWITAGATAVMLLEFGISQRAVIALSFAAAALAVAVVAALFALAGRRVSLAGGGILAAMIALPGLLVFGYFFQADDPTPRLNVASIALLLAPHLAWLGEVPMLRGRRPWQRTLMRVAPVMAVAALLAFVFPPKMP